MEGNPEIHESQFILHDVTSCIFDRIGSYISAYEKKTPRWTGKLS